ncbi:IS66 family insertion sequence element accessory protein TnpA [Amedibacillus sp. YH-ame6]
MPVKYDYDWEKLHKEQQLSGLNMKRFCRERSLPYQSFKNHKYQSVNKADEVSIVPVKCKEQKRISFVMNGVSLSVDASLDDEGLRKIMKALQ